MLTIRRASLDDRESVLAIHRAVAAVGGGIARASDEVAGDVVAAFLAKASATGVALVAELDGRVVGEIHASQFVPRCFHHILAELTIAIEPAAQQQGIGRALLTELVRTVREDRQQFLRIELWVREGNHGAVHMYETLGFQVEARVPRRVHYNGAYDTDVLMVWERGGSVPLLERWLRTWDELRATPHANAFDELLTRWREPHRAYHTLQHLQECLHRIGTVRHACEHSAEIELALWYHDAVYDTRARDNEERSAELVAQVMRAAHVDEDATARVQRLVLATKHDPAWFDQPHTADEALIVDADLGILAADAERFASYQAQVRREYAWADDADYAAGHAGVLKTFLSRPTVFRAPVCTPWEAAARTNLTAALECLNARAYQSVAKPRNWRNLSA
ncbi:MAG: GNAT family N-acetyltransferase [Phycisphaerae bacterium]|nr:GNAT family N-acetyltransferase [Phycisphaerae bacterium]